MHCDFITVERSLPKSAIRSAMYGLKGTSTVVIPPWYPCTDNMQIVDVEKYALVPFLAFDIVTIETVAIPPWYPCIDNMQMTDVEKHALVPFLAFDIVTIETERRVNIAHMAVIDLDKIRTFETNVKINKVQKIYDQ